MSEVHVIRRQQVRDLSLLHTHPSLTLVFFLTGDCELTSSGRLPECRPGEFTAVTIQAVSYLAGDFVL